MTVFMYEIFHIILHTDNIWSKSQRNIRHNIIGPDNIVQDGKNRPTSLRRRYSKKDLILQKEELQNNHSYVQEDHKCANTVRPENTPPLLYDKWHVFKSYPYEVYVYSVFYDERKTHNSYPVIRILSVARPIYHVTYCQIWYPKLTKPIVKEIQVSRNGAGHKLNNTYYEQYYFTCGLETTYAIPHYVSIVAHPCDQANNYIPVYVPVKRAFQNEFAACVPVTFEAVDPYRLTEWVEAVKILGITEINVYHVALSNTTLGILQYYVQKGIVRLQSIPSVPHYEKNRNGNKIGSPISLNDCMYRNMYKYKWVVVIDFDEIIIPKKDNNYADMLKTIDKDEKLMYPSPSYTFRNTYFWTSCPPQNSVPEHSIMLRYTVREKPSNFLYASKSIIDPRQCISVFNHYCYIRFPMKGKNQRWTIDVKTSISTCHHYRQAYQNRQGTKTCEEVKVNGTLDNTVLKWGIILRKNIQKTWKELNLIT